MLKTWCPGLCLESIHLLKIEIHKVKYNLQRRMIHDSIKFEFVSLCFYRFSTLVF